MSTRTAPIAGLVAFSCLILGGSSTTTTASAGHNNEISVSMPHQLPQQQQERQPHLRSLLGRTASVDKTDLICQLGKPHSSESKVESFEIPFYYALGTTGDEDLDFLQRHVLQQELFGSVRDGISWCYRETNKAVTSEVDDGDERQLSTIAATADDEAREGKNSRALEVARKLGILSVGPGPTQYSIGK